MWWIGCGRVLIVAGLAWLAAGCTPSRGVAEAMQVAPNRVPAWMKPSAPVVLRWPAGFSERLRSGTNLVGNPAVPIRWRLVEPADYGFQASWTNRPGKEGPQSEFTFRFRLPEVGLPERRPVVGTAFLLHGYGEDGLSLLPWAIRLAEAGWRSILVDLRGHGDSGGRRVTFGVAETNDLRCLREALERKGVVVGPCSVLGHSLGASVALRWMATDPMVRAGVAFGPYAEFAPPVMRLRDLHARWLPRTWVRHAVRRLPGLVGTTPDGLDTLAAVEGRGLVALVVSGAQDRVTPVADGERVKHALGEGSGFLVVGPSSHEELPFRFDEHEDIVVRWLTERVGGARGGP